MHIDTRHHFGYGYQNPNVTQTLTESPDQAPKETKRQDYGTSLLPKLDDKGYQAFVNATAHYSDVDKKLAAEALERSAAVSAANQYAVSHGVALTKDMDVVYRFFENYQDSISTDQIKHLLNTRLKDVPVMKEKNFDTEAFLSDYLAQLGGSRKLDIKV